jgi:hypothetical protein
VSGWHVVEVAGPVLHLGAVFEKDRPMNPPSLPRPQDPRITKPPAAPPPPRP